MAVFTLDQDMMPFFRANLEYLTDHAVDPDKRRYATKHEAVRHYVDIDHWGTYPYPNVPRDWAEALLWKAEVQEIKSSGDTLVWTVDTIVRVNRNGPEEEIFNGNVPTATLPTKKLPQVSVYATDSVHLSSSAGDKFSLALGDYRTFWYQYMIGQYYEDDWLLECRVQATLNWPVSGDCSRFRYVDHFSEYGILPYHLLQMKGRLTNAFIDKDPAKILRLCAEFGHYIGDAHVPLHTTENYNGQMTDQVGIHGFWESRIVELFADDNYDYFVGKAEYIEDPKAYFWEVVMKSNSLVDSVLMTEKRLSVQYPVDQQFCYEDRADITIRTQCREYAAAWSAAMDGMVEERFRASILGIGSVWYTCWVDAGQPNLDLLLGEGYKAPELDSLERAFRSEKIKGRDHGS
ncbi:hypothetical protein CEQ90_15925 [Lewinellaceae bacterium SD302]|nr:hypothetical protein CEQ90_15925 [Lewinellaceae bacterium SD302]